MGTRAEALRVFNSVEGETRYLAAYDAALADWPTPYEELDIHTRLGATHLIASGPPDAPAVLLLPSLAASALLWAPNVAALSQSYRVYAVDTIGQAGKSIPAVRIRNRRQMAAWITDMLDALGVETAALVGASFGGFLAMNQALLTPARVSRIVLIGPAGTFVGFSWKFYYAMLIRGPLRKLFGGRKRPVTTLPGGRKLEPSGWGRLMAVTMAESARPNLAPATVFSARQLAQLGVPALLLIGEKETLYRAQDVLDLAMARAPGLSGAVIRGADHLVALARPDEVNARILRFLAAS
jgi:pimeloyl-ACP methyl ester carboxylesterase